MNRSYLICTFVIIFFCPLILLSQDVKAPVVSSDKEFITLDGKEVLVRSEYKNVLGEINLDTEARFMRKVGKRVNISELSRASAFEITLGICVDQRGKVISSVVKSFKGKNDKEFIRECQAKIFEYLFTEDYNAPKLDCGVYTFNINPIMSPR